MSPVELVLLALALSMDASAVAAAASSTMERVSPWQLFRFAYHFGLFQAAMPVIGWLAGYQAQAYIEPWDHWLAAGLLFYVGGKAVRAALRDEDEKLERPQDDPTKGWSLILYSVATSIDALAVGLSLALQNIQIVTPAIVIGLITATLTAAAMLLGNKIGRLLGKRMEATGGFVLIGIGVKILVEHLV